MNKKNTITIMILFAMLLSPFAGLKAADELIITTGDNYIKTDRTASISWYTNVENNCFIDYGIKFDLRDGIKATTTAVELTKENITTKYQYIVNLKDLKESTDYYYRVSCSPLDGGDVIQNAIQRIGYDVRDMDLIINDIYFYPNNPVKGQKFTGEIRVIIGNTGTKEVEVVPQTCLYTNILQIVSATTIIDSQGNDLTAKVFSVCGPTVSGNESEAVYYEIKDAVFNSDIVFNSMVDDGEAIREANDANNVFSKEIKITATSIVTGDNTVIDMDAVLNNGDNVAIGNLTDKFLAETKQVRNLVKEQNVKTKYLDKLIDREQKTLNKMEMAINDFIAYGVDLNTQKLGEGERAAVVSSYKSAFVRLPEVDDELTDLIKIANGRWPSFKNSNAEKRARGQFIKIYKRIANMGNANDNAAVTVMAYGLRQKAENRNMNSEKNGIKTFKSIFGKNPTTTDEWNTMQAITYSGASRGKDSDGDLLTDDREKILGTDVNNKDSDGDGYIDGIEVDNGYNPLKK
ncbi:fibronectin type III domain-containing protein [Candidatus Parcubacteria bacterium]|nr:fibronectin type III domain-containing protein [Patescibacteria group bacterium]MBU4308916.1 fibronectin type III domain-containing protein [Patescibacteria group bacterium]MBU4432582.1 fibronectin type III domain-containing protein [Patescibacteria group bacterium]MBU4577276.1 fibronectin type III domain-containing protein [Patescibacteria group bacterium]MCG2696966.1 fibronectin type III domain-containing protein [Candidatus Parcubacteria bacterium]